MIPEAAVEHQTLKDLITQIKDIEPNGEIYDSKVKILSEHVKHHIKEEQTEIFPEEKAAKKLDLIRLDSQLFERKNELVAEII